MNRRLEPGIETVFMMPAEPYTYVSSRLVKEVVALGGSVHGLVNCAGANEDGALPAASVEGWDRMLRINLTSDDDVAPIAAAEGRHA